MPVDMQMGQFDSVARQERENADEVQRMFDKISPLINKALEYIRLGKSHKLKFWKTSCRLKSSSSVLVSVSAGNRGVSIDLFGYCHFLALLELIEGFYGLAGLGFIIEGANCYDHERKKSIHDQFYIEIQA